MASVQINTSSSVKRNRFESTSTHILLYDPVDKKSTSNKRGYSEISDTSKVKVSSFGTKAGIRKTVVHLWYHNHPEYATLSNYHKEELREWQLKNLEIMGREKGQGNKLPNIGKSIASALNKQVEKTLSAAIKDAEY